jgi:copper chaperone
MTTEFKVPDATCGHCKATIESAVTEISGVTGAELDLETKLLKVEHGTDTDSGALASAISSAGYTPQSA